MKKFSNFLAILILLLATKNALASDVKKKNIDIPQSPRLEISTFRGENFDLQKNHGKITIVVFWAHWCSVCKFELNQLQNIHQKYRDKNVEIIGIALDTNKNKSKTYEIANKLSFKNGAFENAKINDFPDPKFIPMLYFIDGEGKLLKTFDGEVKANEIVQIIDQNLAKNKLNNDIKNQQETLNDKSASKLVKISFKSFDGSKFDLKNTKNKVTIVNFWASWCGYCRREFAVLKEIKQKYNFSGVEIIGISMDESDAVSNAKKIAENLNFKNGHFAEAAIENLEAPNAFPKTYFLNDKNEVFYKFDGFAEQPNFVRIIEGQLFPR